MNELLEKARQMYPIGTKVKSMYTSEEYVITKNIFSQYGNIYATYNNFSFIAIYDKDKNKWAEIINQNNMTQQEFNALRVGDFIGQYEILHKYNEFLIVRCEDGHDLFDLNKINKLGLKVTPKTFMGLEIKKYDSVPCEIDDKELYYLFEVSEKAVLLGAEKHNMEFYFTPNSIRIL